MKFSITTHHSLSPYPFFLFISISLHRQLFKLLSLSNMISVYDRSSLRSQQKPR